jgi:hypothetical protein
LAAVLAADVAGYSRLMGVDEVGTARTLREHRVVTDALVSKHGGRIVKTTGDGVLLEFPSVVDAVEVRRRWYASQTWPQLYTITLALASFASGPRRLRGLLGLLAEDSIERRIHPLDFRKGHAEKSDAPIRRQSFPSLLAHEKNKTREVQLAVDLPQLHASAVAASSLVARRTRGSPVAACSATKDHQGRMSAFPRKRLDYCAAAK